MAPMPMKSPPTPCSKHRRKNKFPKHKTKRPAIHRIAGFAFPLRLLLQRHAAISSTHRGDFVSCSLTACFPPDVWENVVPCSIGNEIQPAAGRYPANAGRYPCYAWTIFARFARKRRSPETISVSGLRLPWQLSTLAGPVVRLPSTC